MTHDLNSDYKWYIDHKPELLAKHRGRVLAIRNGAVVGVYDTEPEAVRETARKYELGTFLVQPCQEDEEPQVFHSRVVFA